MHGAEVWIGGVEGIRKGFEDRDIRGIGARLGIVLFLECGHVIIEYGMVLLGSDVEEAGIFSTQVGDPLADGSEDLRYGTMSDISLAAAGPFPASADVDDDVVEPVVDIGDVRKCRLNMVLVAELGPFAKFLARGSPGSRDIGRSGGLERSAEVSREASSGCRVRIRQGLLCG